jgi:hypothetical protein
MSDANYEFEEDAKDQVERNPVRAQLRNLEAKNKELEAKLSAATEAQRKLAFVEAGVDINAPSSRYFVKGYEGEMTADAIRQAAQEVNLIGATQVKPEVQAEQNAWNRVSKAKSFGDNSEPEVDWNTKIRNAKSQEEVMQVLTQASQASQNI